MYRQENKALYTTNADDEKKTVWVFDQGEDVLTVPTALRVGARYCTLNSTKRLKLLARKGQESGVT